MKKERRACPFCRSMGTKFEPVAGGVRLYCRDCSASGPSAATEDIAVDFWNVRGDFKSENIGRPYLKEAKDQIHYAADGSFDYKISFYQAVKEIEAGWTLRDKKESIVIFAHDALQRHQRVKDALFKGREVVCTCKQCQVFRDILDVL